MELKRLLSRKRLKLAGFSQLKSANLRRQPIHFHLGMNTTHIYKLQFIVCSVDALLSHKKGNDSKKNKAHRKQMLATCLCYQQMLALLHTHTHTYKNTPAFWTDVAWRLYIANEILEKNFSRKRKTKSNNQAKHASEQASEWAITHQSQLLCGYFD